MYGKIYHINGTDKGLGDLVDLGKRLEAVGRRVCPDCDDHDFIQCGLSLQACGTFGWDDEIMDRDLNYIEGIPFITVKEADGEFIVTFDDDEAVEYKE